MQIKVHKQLTFALNEYHRGQGIPNTGSLSSTAASITVHAPLVLVLDNYKTLKLVGTQLVQGNLGISENP